MAAAMPLETLGETAAPPAPPFAAAAAAAPPPPFATARPLGVAPAAEGSGVLTKNALGSSLAASEEEEETGVVEVELVNFAADAGSKEAA